VCLQPWLIKSSTNHIFILALFNKSHSHIKYLYVLIILQRVVQHVQPASLLSKSLNLILFLETDSLVENVVTLFNITIKINSEVTNSFELEVFKMLGTQNAVVDLSIVKNLKRILIDA